MFESYLEQTGTVVYPTSQVDILPYGLYGLYSGACSVVYQNEMHLFGGSQDTDGTSTLYYHYAWNGYGWRSVSTLPFRSVNSVAVVYDGRIHVLGGDRTDSSRYHYTWDGEAWEKLDNLPMPISANVNKFSSGVFVYGGKLHIMGYSSTNVFIKAHFSFDGNNWTQETDCLDDGNSCVFMFDSEIRTITSDKKYYVYSNNEWVYLKDIVNVEVYKANNHYGIEYNGKYYFFGHNGNTLVFDGDELVHPSWDDIQQGVYTPADSTPAIYNNQLHLMGGRYLYYDRPHAHKIFDDVNGVFNDCTNNISYIYIKTRKNPL